MSKRKEGRSTLGERRKAEERRGKRPRERTGDGVYQGRWSSSIAAALDEGGETHARVHAACTKRTIFPKRNRLHESAGTRRGTLACQASLFWFLHRFRIVPLLT